MKISDGDYVLVDGSAWIETNGVSVRIYTDPNGVVHVSAYRVMEESDEPISEFSVHPE